MPASASGDSEGPALAAGDSLDAFYDARYDGDYMARHDALEVERVSDVLLALEAKPARLLDYGCGTGAWIPVLRRAFPDAEIVGVEISEVAVRRAAEDFPEQRFLHFDGNRAPLPDGQFDLVFSYHVLEHVWDLPASVADMARLTAPGGSVCACLPCANAGSVGERATRLVERGVERSATGERRFFFEDPGHLRSVATSALEREFAANGLGLDLACFSGPWAELEYFSRRPHRVRALFDAGRGVSRGARAKLAATRAVLLAVGALVGLGSTPVAALRSRLGRGPARRRARALAGLALQPVARPLSRLVLAAAPRREWTRRRRRRPGSGQYLLFGRPG